MRKIARTKTTTAKIQVNKMTVNKKTANKRAAVLLQSNHKIMQSGKCNLDQLEALR